MPSNNYGLNLATKAGEGGADVLQWGNLDKAANQLYQEQKLREQRGYNDYLQGQQSLQKEFANVLAADIPDVVNEYNGLKKLKQAILFDDKIKNNPIALAQAQQAANIKEAQFRQLVAASQEQKKRDESTNNRFVSHPDDFREDAGKLFMEHRGMPTLQRLQKGYSDISPYLELGGTTDWGDLSRKAIGEKRLVPFGAEIITPDQWQLEQKQIERSNTPTQYATQLRGNIMSKKIGRDARSYFDNMPKEKMDEIIDKFNAIPDAEYESRWGQPKRQLLDGVSADDKAGQFVLLDAMNYATENMPKDAKSVFRDNKSYIDNLKDAREFNEWMIKNKITSGQAMDRARLYRQFQQEKENAATGGVDQYIQESRTGQLYPRSAETPSAVDVEIVRFPETVTKELSDWKGGDVENVGLLPDGRFFDIKTVSSGKYKGSIDWANSKEIPLIQIKSAVTNKALPSNFKVKQVTAPSKNQPQKSTGKKKISGF